MELAQNSRLQERYLLAVVRSFAIWSFTLLVCWLVAGFPLVAIVTSVGVMFAIALQSVLPVSAVLLVSGGLLSANLLVVFLIAAILTARGIHPQEVSWLHWLHGKAMPSQTVNYASCPLSCSLFEQ